ncbi:methyltransferase domain-containing protein [Streptomyces sp. HNM0575]|uniref:class I SAM-dependent methyltransferase n=1 Tax=Streptomyces sp. HNM0575 TaxID=2716338 RepID=UPI00145D985D|nr:class I SAM-dependent methyltransferase [Streptomyces sp. HNM0575]NLU73445.1 methyltransferase domain-containing protein [Streptomyces sp. HNM0575]
MPVPAANPAHGRPVRHPVFARFYERLSEAADVQSGVRAHRGELLAGLGGRVIEVGAGNGLNFARYPAEVSRVTAVEPEPRLRASAVRAARAAAVRVPVSVVAGRAEALPVGDATCDAAVCSLVLCSLPDVQKALTEVLRVLRPGGELRFYEHGRAQERPGMVRFQRALDATVGPFLFGGCHSGRDPVGEIGAAGFTDISFRRVVVPQDGPVFPASFHVLGGARRP